MIKAAIVLSTIAAAAAAGSTDSKLGVANIEYFDFTCADRPEDQQADTPYISSVTVTSGVCQYEQRAGETYGSFVVNCANKGDDNEASGTIFFCSDTQCSDCTATPFTGSKNKPSDRSCQDTNSASGARSYQVYCSRPNDVDNDNNDGASMVGISAVSAVVAAAAIMF